MTTLINSNGYLVISLPHVGHAAVLSCLINGDFEYRDWGLLDRTHIRFFGLKNIESLFAQANLKIIEARYVTKSPEKTELAANWSKLSSNLQNLLMKGKYSEIYQVVIKAVPIDYAGDMVSLVPPEHKYRRTLFTRLISWKIRLGTRLSSNNKIFIRRILKLMNINL